MADPTVTDPAGQPDPRRPRPTFLPIPDPVLSASSDDLIQSSASAPPYQVRPSASSHNLNEIFVNSPYHDYPPSPAYRSKVDMHDDGKPKVHYDEHERPNSPFYGNHGPPIPGSGPPSTIGTDDDYDGNEESDYDWSGEEDLIDEETKMEEKFGVKPKQKGWSFKRIITLLFSSLIGSTLLAGIMVAPGVLIHFFWYKPHPSEYRYRIKNNVQAWLFWAAANLLISWYLAVIIDIVPTVCISLVSLVWGHVSESAKTRVELYNSVKNTIKPAFYAASCWASWVIIFGGIYKLYNVDEPKQSTEGYTFRVFQVVEMLFFLVLVFCAQKMLSHAVAFQFHRTAFRERLDELGTALKVIEKLRNYRPKFTQAGWKTRSAGWRTPLWGNTPAVEKDYFDWSGKGRTDGAEADTEADHPPRPSRKNTLEDAKGKKRASGSSWVMLGGRRQGTYEETSESGHGHSKTLSGAVTPKLILPTESGRASPIAESPHRYPPTAPSSLYNQPRDGPGENIATTAAKALKSAVLHDARNIKGKDTDGLAGLIGGTTQEAKRLARGIYYKFKPMGVARKYLLPGDFSPAFSTSTGTGTGGTTPVDADAAVSPETLAAFRVFDKDNNGDISRAEIKTTLIRVYRERRALARSMRDVNQALETLDHIMGFFAFVIVFFISLQVFGVEVGDSLTSVYSLGIAASFIFKNAASSAFDAIMFLFVTHPFDTGDRVFVGEENLVVKKMGLFATVFTRVDGTETYFFNSMLFNMFITNIRRSANQFETCTLQVHWRTPLAKLDALENAMNAWLSTEENRWFEPATGVTLQKIEFQRYLEVTVGISHNANWQDWGLRVARKTAFHAAVNYYCQQIGITTHESPIPVMWGDEESVHTLVEPLSPSLYQEDVVDDDASGQHGMGPTLAPPTTEAPGMTRSPSTTFMGFKPPEGHAAHLRARKSKGRKAVMRGMDG